MKLWKIGFIMAFVVTVLCGCNFMTGNIETLLKAPSPNNMQKGLSVAIGESIGTNIKYVTPQTGSIKKSFVLDDLDGDERDEALLFYTTVDATGLESFAGIGVFASDDQGVWKLIKNIQGSSTKIDYVELRDFTLDGNKEILVGWKQAETLNELCAYNVYSQSNEAIFTDAYNESKLFYDGYNFLILNLYKDVNTGKGTAKMNTLAGSNLKTVASCEIYGGYDSIASIIFQKIRIDRKVILIDARLGNNMITQALFWEDGRLTNPYYDSQTGVNPALIRETEYVCQDIDKDGYIDIPFTTPLPAMSAIANSRDLVTATMTGWASLNLPEESAAMGVISRKFYCIMDPALKCYFKVPNEWIGKFSATYNTSDYSIAFYHYSNEQFTKMFSLYSLTQEQFKERKEQGTWFELRKSGQRVYAINISEELSTEIGEFMGNMQLNRERLILT